MRFPNKYKVLLIITGLIVLKTLLFVMRFNISKQEDANQDRNKQGRNNEAIAKIPPDALKYWYQKEYLPRIKRDSIPIIIQKFLDKDLQTRFAISYARGKFRYENYSSSLKDSIKGIYNIIEHFYNHLESPTFWYCPREVFVISHYGVGENKTSWLLYSEMSPDSLMSHNPGFLYYNKNEKPNGDFCWIWELGDNWYIYSPRKNALYEDCPSNNDITSDNQSIQKYWIQQKDTIKYICKLMHNLKADEALSLSNNTVDGYFEINKLVPYVTLLKMYSSHFDYGFSDEICHKLNTMYPDFCPFRFKYYNKRYFDIEVLSSNHLHFYIFLTKEAYYEVADDVDLQWLERGCYYSN